MSNMDIERQNILKEVYEWEERMGVDIFTLEPILSACRKRK